MRRSQHPARARLVATLTTLSAMTLGLAPAGAAGATGAVPTAKAPHPRPDPASAGPHGDGHREVARLVPRLVVADTDGITTIDSATGRVIARTPRSGFLRLADAGDGRHVAVADSDEFVIFDAGVQARRHGDHEHYETYTPHLTSVRYPAPHAGHVVLNGGFTTLFSDGTGRIQVIPSARIASPKAPVARVQTRAPHHGVALRLSNGDIITTQGTQAARSTVEVLRRGRVVARATNCPGVHGEAVAAPTRRGDVVAFGCENGPLIYRDGRFTKTRVADTYARTGNLAGSPVSPIVLTDYKVDKGAQLERPTRVGLLDTRTGRLTKVELGSAYWFRSLARGPRGQAIVLTADGSLRILDPLTGRGRVIRKVITPWTEKADWQQPGPVLAVAGAQAFVTDAATKRVSVVDLNRFRVRRFALPAAAVEMAVVTGRPATQGGRG